LELSCASGIPTLLKIDLSPVVDFDDTDLEEIPGIEKGEEEKCAKEKERLVAGVEGYCFSSSSESSMWLEIVKSIFE